MSIMRLGQLPRSPWAVEVLTEHLVAEAPACSSLQNAVNRLRTKSSSDLLLDMAGERVIKTSGAGARAFYAIADDCLAHVLILETALTREEGSAIQRAAQRSNAIFAAWVKASATWAS